MLRENIFQFIKDNSTLFVPKNSGLNDYVRNMLPEIGIDVDPEDLKKGKYKGGIKIGSIEILLARGEDIPQRVSERNKAGRTTYGLTGNDLYDEAEACSRRIGFGRAEHL